MTEQIATGILESISHAVVAIDRQWRYAYVNTAAERLTGHQREEMLGRTHWEIFPAVVGTPSDIAYHRAMDERVTVHFDEYDAPSDKWFSQTVYPSSNGVVVHTQDITDRKRAEEALQKGEERFRRYFELGLIGMAITSPEKGILDVNDEICRILGYDRSELLQMTWVALTHPDDLATDLGNFNQVMAGEIDGYSIDKRWIRKDGQVIHGTIQ
jgi:PAS domain S-box-containing protein